MRTPLPLLLLGVPLAAGVPPPVAGVAAPPPAEVVVLAALLVLAALVLALVLALVVAAALCAADVDPALVVDAAVVGEGAALPPHAVSTTPVIARPDKASNRRLVSVGRSCSCRMSPSLDDRMEPLPAHIAPDSHPFGCMSSKRPRHTWAEGGDASPG